MSGLSEIVALLQTVPALRLVQPAADMTALPEIKAYPAALVYPLSRKAEGNALATVAVRQTKTKYFVVVTVCHVEQLEDVQQAIFKALVGKVVEQDISVSEIVDVEGDVMDLSASKISWRDVFSYRVSPLYHSSLAP